MTESSEMDQMRIQHARLINELGGTSQVAQILSSRTGRNVTRAAVAMMRQRGRIPYRYRGALLEVAATRGLRIPVNFLTGA